VSISAQKMLVAAVVTLASSAARATPKPVDPDSLPRVECSALRYSEAFLAKYPKAPAACLEARVYKGETYMKAKGTVYVVDPPAMSFAFMDQFGNTLGTVTVKNPDSLRVIINGQVVSAKQLRDDETLTFWVPESIFAAESTPTSR